MPHYALLRSLLSARRALLPVHFVAVLSVLVVSANAERVIAFDVNAEPPLLPPRVTRMIRPAAVAIPETGRKIQRPLSFDIAESVTQVSPVQSAVFPLCTPLTFDWKTVGGETWTLTIYQGSERIDDFPLRVYSDFPTLSITIPVEDALPAGQYTWYVVASTLAGDAWSDYRQFTILPSCPADLDGNGIVDPGDLADFMKCFFSMPPCPAADFNADGTTDPDDLADFITAFFTGC